MTRTRPTEFEPLVGQFQHLAEKRRAPEALEKLQKIASLVKPLMRQRNWRVGTLAEFYPEQTNLLGLNINRGEKICLRLRYPGDDTQFLPMEEVVDTMLHELAHNVIGPHNQEFHALWDKLRDEHEALIRKGYTGEGFLSQGRRLGGRGIPISEVRRQARAAAEKRKVLSAGSGQKLGGRGILRGQDARSVIAAAAERRMRIQRGCASETQTGRDIAREDERNTPHVVTTQAPQSDETEDAWLQAYIDLIQEEEREMFGKDYLPPTQDNPAGMKAVPPSSASKPAFDSPISSRALLEQQRQIEANLQKKPPNQIPSTLSRPSRPSYTSTTPLPPPPPVPPQSTRPPSKRPADTTYPNNLISPPPPSESAIKIRDAPSQPNLPQPTTELLTWTCDICTLINPIQYLTCDACGTERPGLYSTTPPPRSSSPDEQFSTSTNPFSTKPYGSASSTRNSMSSTSNPSTTTKHTALQPRLNAYDSIARISEQATSKIQLAPVGWTCMGCGTFMENQWWTCSACGMMKGSS